MTKQPPPKPPWKNKKKGRGGKLTPEQIEAAKSRAAASGRPYPNLIDNMWAAKMGKL